MTEIKIDLVTANRSHKYYISGDPKVDPKKGLPSCTTVGKFVDTGGDGLIYWGIDQYIAPGERSAFATSRDESGAIGSRLHDDIDQYIRTGEWPNPASMLFSTWYAAVGEIVRFSESEVLIYNGNLGYGGTVDALGAIDDKRVIFDWKTVNLLDSKGKRKSDTSVPRISYASQIGGYILALEYMGKPVDAAYVLSVGRDIPESVWAAVDIPAAKTLFMASLSVYNATRTKSIKAVADVGSM